MKLVIEPAPKLPVFTQDLLLVISMEESAIPELFFHQDTPAPDRHLLLGMAQWVSVAVQENDAQLFERLEEAVIGLDLPEGQKRLQGRLIVAKAEDGSFGVLGVGESADVKRLAREALRYFTGAIRLDIP